MTLRTRLTGLTATLAIVAIVIALPITLLAVGGNPLPEAWPSLEQARAALTSPDDGTLALAAFKILGWAAWAFLTGAIASKNEDLAHLAHEVHELLFWALLLVLVAHVGAALKHHVFDNDNVLRRMLPFGRPRD